MAVLIVSLNEVETATLKAARGAGLAWGIAEEVGHACRWLAARSIAFEAPLVRVLTEEQNSPIAAGAFLSDAAQQTASRCPINLDTVAEPLLLLPFIANVARTTGQSLLLEWPGSAFVLTPQDAFSTAANSTEAVLRHWKSPSGASLSPLKECIGGVPVVQLAWSQLGEFALRTLVPDSATSRRKGAGSAGAEED